MIAEAIERITTLADEACRFEKIAERFGRIVWFDRDEVSIGEYRLPIAPRRHHAYTLTDLCGATQALASENKIVVWIGRGNVEAILNDNDDRMHRIALQLPKSPEFSAVEKLQARQVLTQAQLIKLLRIELAEVGLDALLSAVRQVKFTNNSEGQSTIEQGRVNVNRSILREVSGAAKLPETVEIGLWVYDDVRNDSVRQTIRCALDVDVDAATFMLIPVGGQVRAAERATDAYIVGLVVQEFARLGAKFDVFQGNANHLCD